MHVEERHKGRAAEGTGAVEVGVVCRPARHDLLVIHQTVAGLAQRAAGHQHLTTQYTHTHTHTQDDSSIAALRGERSVSVV